jgi:hypothetical protein
MRKKTYKKTLIFTTIIALGILLLIPQKSFAKFSVWTVGATDIKKQSDSLVSVTLNGGANPDNKNIAGFFRFAISDSAPDGNCDTFTVYPPWIQTPYLSIAKSSDDTPFKITLPLPKDKTIYFCAGANDIYSTTRGGSILKIITNTSNISDYTLCAQEGDLCYSMKKDTLYSVAFGANNSYLFTKKNTYFICDPSSFGGADPIPGTPKSCYIKEISEDDLLNILSGKDIMSGVSIIKEAHTSSTVAEKTHESVKLSGSILLNSASTGPTLPAYGYFRYSPVSPGSVSPIFCNEVFGDNMKSTPEIEVAGNPTLNPRTVAKTFSLNVSELEPNTTYYYCAVGSDRKVIKYGAMEHFTTANDPGVSLSSVTTKPATSISSTSAKLNGIYNSSVASSTWFEYRKKITYQDLVNAVATAGTSISRGINLFPFNAFVSDISSSLNRPAQNNTQISISSQNAIQAGNLSPSSGNIEMASVQNVSSKINNPYDWSGRINYQTHLAGEGGSLNYLLKNLQKNTTYEFRAGIEINPTGNNPEVTYGGILNFRTPDVSVTDGDVESSDTDNNDHESNNTGNLSLGDQAVPPEYALVRYHEGIEHVLVRQIMRPENLELAEMFGYQEGANLENFAWYMADFLARTFGYVSPSGKEIRVGPPDRAAYQLIMKDGKLTIYEYFDSEIVAIQNISSSLRKNYNYEYYYTKKVSE